MKKQLLIAAVAASMTSVAMADISITGGAKVNYVYVEKGASSAAPLTSNDFNHDMDLTVKGVNGDTTVSMTMATTTSATTPAANMLLEDVYLSTKIGNFGVKTGNWDNGNNILRASARKDGKFSVTTSVEGIGIAYDDSEDGNATVKVSGSIEGIDAYYKAGTVTDDWGFSGTVGGVSFDYDSMDTDTASTNKTSLKVDGTINGVTLTYAMADADSSAKIDGDNWFGNYEASGTSDGDDLSGFGASMKLAGNTVQVRAISIDASTDVDYTKFYVTRALSNGTTFEAIYTDKDTAGGTTLDTETLDLELAVKF